MNTTIEKTYRDKILSGLSRCSETQQMLFKRMYAKGNMGWSLKDIVNEMPTEKLDWALTQIENTLNK